MALRQKHEIKEVQKLFFDTNSKHQKKTMTRILQMEMLQAQNLKSLNTHANKVWDISK